MQSIKVTVIMTINAKESLSAVMTIVLQIFRKMLTAVNYQVQVRKLRSANGSLLMFEFFTPMMLPRYGVILKGTADM